MTHNESVLDGELALPHRIPVDLVRTEFHMLCRMKRDDRGVRFAGQLLAEQFRNAPSARLP